MKKDIFRADISSEYDIPSCPMCGGKMYIEDIDKFRVAHFCKDKSGRHVKTVFCRTAEEAVQKYINGEIIVK